MSEGINLVSGGAELLDEIDSLWEKLNQHHTARAPHFADVFAANTYEKRKKNILEHAALGLHVLMALDKAGERVGYCVSTINGKHVGEIDSLYVLPEYRGKGLGETLVRESIDWLQMQGVARIFLEVAAGNEEVYGFYARFGFHPAKIILERKA